jgi:hypothetical protein
MRKLLLIVVLVLGAGAAYADNGTFYVGAGISRDNLKDITATDSDLNSTNWKIWAGFRPISPFAVEADYIDLGSETVNSAVSSTHVDYRAFAAYAVGYLPIPVPYLDVFGKAGLARWNSSGSSTAGFPPGSFFSLSDEGTEFAWGVGTQVHVGNFGGRLEFENFSIRNTNGANIVSLSVFLNLF